MGASDKDRVLAHIAEAQYGLVGITQATASGLSETAIRKRVHSGRLHRELPGVLALPGAPESWHRRVMAACLWAGTEAAASHGTAAALMRLPGFSRGPIQLSTTLARKPHGLPIRVHRVSKHLLSEIVFLDGIPATSPRRTLLDLAGIKHPRVGRALDHLLLKGETSLGHVWLLYEEEWTRGRRGIAILRNLLRERTGGRAPSDSDLADLMWRIVRDYDLPIPAAEYPVALDGYTIHADFAYPDSRVLIELDGYAFHMDREAFERDRERDNDLQALGWRVLRFTWAMLRWQPDRVASTLLAHLSEASSGRQRAI